MKIQLTFTDNGEHRETTLDCAGYLHDPEKKTVTVTDFGGNKHTITNVVSLERIP